MIKCQLKRHGDGATLSIERHFFYSSILFKMSKSIPRKVDAASTPC